MNEKFQICRILFFSFCFQQKQYIGPINAFQDQNVDFHSIFQAQKKHHIYFLKSFLRLNINAPAEIKGAQWHPSDIFCHNFIILE